jgi:hypothetical protein
VWFQTTAALFGTDMLTFANQMATAIYLLTLARNARTSVEMIERFYASNLTAEMNIDLLQGKRN